MSLAVQGILSVTVVRAAHLVGWSGEPDPYVHLELYDPASRSKQQHTSSVMFNDDNPRQGHDDPGAGPVCMHVEVANAGWELGPGVANSDPLGQISKSGLVYDETH